MRRGISLIMTLDLGVSCGVAKGHAGEIPESFSVLLKQKEDERRVALANLEHFLIASWKRDRPDAVVTEAPINLAGMKNLASAAHSVRMAYALAGIVEALCHIWKIPHREIHDATVRKHFLGKGRIGTRKQTKDAVVARAKLLKYIPRDCEDDDRADACSIWDWASAHLARHSPVELHLFGEERTYAAR